MPNRPIIKSIDDYNIFPSTAKIEWIGATLADGFRAELEVKWSKKHDGQFVYLWIWDNNNVLIGSHLRFRDELSKHIKDLPDTLVSVLDLALLSEGSNPRDRAIDDALAEILNSQGTVRMVCSQERVAMQLTCGKFKTRGLIKVSDTMRHFLVFPSNAATPSSG